MAVSCNGESAATSETLDVLGKSYQALHAQSFALFITSVKSQSFLSNLGAYVVNSSKVSTHHLRLHTPRMPTTPQLQRTSLPA